LYMLYDCSYRSSAARRGLDMLDFSSLDVDVLVEAKVDICRTRLQMGP